jgi:OHCU decarboxylase
MQKLADLNVASREEFTGIVAPVFEHSPWIAARTAAQRPFRTVWELHAALCETVHRATPEEQLSLIRAHPDLVGQATLTDESAAEQTSAGLRDLSPDERTQFAEFNRRYHERFGFPFVICARSNRKDAIMAAFPERLKNSPEQEKAAALAEIFKIAELRLNDLVK